MQEIYKDVAERLKELREIFEYTYEDMAKYTDVSVEEYTNLESGKEDFSFTFLHKAAKALNVDITDLIKGESPRLTTYEITRENEGFPIKRRIGFDYQSIAHMFKEKIIEPFVVKVAYDEEALNKPISLSTHEGHELDYVLEGELKVSVDSHEVTLKAGDSIYYDSSKPHGMVAASKSGVKFLAVVANYKNKG